MREGKEMRELLGEKDKRRLCLFETIALFPGITIDELASKLNLSTIQVQTDIGFYHGELDPVKIVVQKNKECYLDIPSEASIKLVYRFLLKNNLNFRVLESVFLNKYESYEQLAKELFISQATLKRALTMINQELKPYEMKIKSRPLGIYGKEENIRGFYSFYFQECYPDLMYPFDPAAIKIAESLIDTFIQEFSNDKNNFASRNRLRLQVVVALYREQRGYVGKGATTLQPMIQKRIANSIQRFKYKEIFQLYVGTPLSETVYQSLFHHFFNDHFAFSEEDFKERLVKQPENQDLFQGVEELITGVSRELALPVENLNAFTLKIYNVLAITYQMTITPYVLHQNREAFTLLSVPLNGKILRTVKELFYQYLPEVAQRNEAYFYEVFYLLIIHWPDFYELLIQAIPACKIGLFFISDLEHMSYVKSHLIFLYGKKIEVDILSVNELRELPSACKDKDVLLCNFILDDHVKLPIPHVSIVDVLSQDDTDRIEKIIDRIYYRNMHE